MKKNDKWLVIQSNNTENNYLHDLNLVFKGNGFCLFSNQEIHQKQILDKPYFIIVNGNILPRINSRMYSCAKSIKDNIIKKYANKGADFINDIKGALVLIVGSQDGFCIFSDRLGIKKFFQAKCNGENYYSNDIAILRSLTHAEVNPSNIAIYSLTNRFPNGITMFKDIYYSQPATHLSFKENEVKIKQYWTAEELFYSKKEKSTYSEFANKIKNVIKQHLDFFKPNELSITLTGGLDSRILLGSLLHYGYKPKTFTFGHPESGDVKVAKKLAKSLSLTHNNYYEANPTPEWFDGLTKKIREKGNSLINFHRAYRLDGLLKDKEKNPSTDMTIVGHAGGEPIRGLFYDNLIVPDFVKNYIPGNEGNREQAIRELKRRFIVPAQIDLDSVLEFLDNLPYLKAQGKEREFLLIFDFLIANHLYQDLNLYDAYHDKIITSFMDIDYLEYLFSTQFSMLYKDNTSSNKLKRLNIPELHSNVIKQIYPRLTDFQLNKGYSPAEYLQNKYVCAIKKAWRDFRTKKSHPNFGYNNWFIKYLNENWTTAPEPWLKESFDLSKAKNHLESNDHGSTEKYWIKFSSIIMLNEFSNFY